jgi:transcription elongation GreA/GreB family factor
MITATDKLALKKRMLEACVTKQENLIGDFKERIQALRLSTPLGNEEEYDNNVLAQNSQSADEITALNATLNFANAELRVLNHMQVIPDRIPNAVAPGAVVVTDRATFFVSVSIEEFEVDGETILGISDKSPIYNAMKGKKKGHTFSYNGLKYKILDLF